MNLKLRVLGGSMIRSFSTKKLRFLHHPQPSFLSIAEDWVVFLELSTSVNLQLYHETQHSVSEALS